MGSNGDTEKEPSRPADQDRRFDHFADEINSAPSHDAIMTLLQGRLLDVCGVDMASVFLIDSLKMQLVSWLVLPGESLRKIRIPIDKTSVAGYTASAREQVFINDPYDKDELNGIDPGLKFDSSWDSQAGIHTRQVLSTPIMVQRSLLGVIQLMNKRDGDTFSEIDKHHIENLANTLGNALLRLQNPS
ncbi:MAG: GAF domain-containing protein [Desulfobulbaceae bacterium]|nr:GAF domain-containing protein [Desulfobulbaceae bacterium]